MSFVQIIEFSTADFDAMEALGEEWDKATKGKRTARRAIFARDRNDPSHCFNIVFFDSYESAMENSALPETQALAEKMGAVVTGPPAFYDLDIVNDRS